MQDFLFLVNGEYSFILDSLRELLAKSDFRTDKTEFNMKSLEIIRDMPTLFVTDAETLLSNKEARVFLYDRCIEHNRKIVLIGAHDTLANVYEITATNVIAASYERPVNNSEIVEQLGQLIEGIKLKGKKKKILVVDDSPTFLRLISEWLENDYNVNVCPSATAAFHMIDTNKPDLILLDYEMPICNGAQFLQMLHSEHMTENIPVIFLTSKGDAETVKSVISLKPQGYLLKNQSKEKTLGAIAEYFIKEQMK